MLLIYRILINFIFFLSPLIIFFRLIKKKEDIKRFKEKIGFFSKKKVNGKLIWFHGASVGEIKSIVPLIKKFQKNKKIKQILITSNTLSSSYVIKKLKIRKITHQFFPIDTDFISKKFIDYWKPSKAFFIDSEIWPNTILNLSKKKIPIILINGRITKKSFNRWNYFPDFSKKIFSKLNLCLASSQESLNYLKKLQVKNVKYFGNLKFSVSEDENFKENIHLRNFLKKKKVWCASSTHSPEEIFCANVHRELKNKNAKILTIIIPRHIERSEQIKNDLKNLNLKVHLDEPQKKIDKSTDIYLVNSYGKTKFFFKNSKSVFIGGSIVKHGGQNPLEAARLGCNILSGPNVENFRDVYKFLEKNKISQKIFNSANLANNLNKLFYKEKQTTKIQRKIKLIGSKILERSYKEINF